MAESKIIDYRDLSDDEIALVNKVKEFGNELQSLVNEIQFLNPDNRWLAIGVTDLQKGLMAVIRSITKPESF